jgi:hypothetical protein
MRQPSLPVSWNYASHPNRRKVLRREVDKILTELHSGAIDAANLVADTRPYHRRMFSRLTPPGAQDFARHYRGESIAFLKNYRVGIPGNPFVGCPPTQVRLELQKLDAISQLAIKGLDDTFSSLGATASSESKLIALIKVTARLFGHFLSIHPYADGNGHAGRLIVIALLGRYNFWPTKFSLEPRPPGEAYSDCIRQWQWGNAEPLENLLLEYVIG